MNPIIIYENEIYAIGYSYETDWPNLCYTVDRAAYWSIVNFSNMDGDAYSKIANKRGEEIAFWLCKEIGDFGINMFSRSGLYGNTSLRNGFRAVATNMMMKNAILKCIQDLR